MEKVKDLQALGGSAAIVLFDNGSVAKVSGGKIGWESLAADRYDLLFLRITWSSYDRFSIPD